MALFVKHHVSLLDSELVAEASMAERGCAWTADLLAKRSESDGWFLRSKLRGEGADDALIDGCVQAGLLEADGRRLRPVGWLGREPSQTAIRARSMAKRLDGIKGNHGKWHEGEFEVCAACQAKVAEVIATSETGAIAEGSQNIAELDKDKDPSERSPLTIAPDENLGFAGPAPVASLDAARSALEAARREAGAQA